MTNSELVEKVILAMCRATCPRDNCKCDTAEARRLYSIEATVAVDIILEEITAFSTSLSEKTKWWDLS